MQSISARSSKLCLSVAWWSKDKNVSSASLRSTFLATTLQHQALNHYQNVSQQFMNSLLQILKKKYSLEWLTFTTDSCRYWLATYILCMRLAKEDVKQLPGQMIAKLALTLPSSPWSAALLEHPTIGCKLAITVDASDFTVGGSLDQFCNGSWHPLAFFSKKFTTAERKYATFDRELLALYLGIKQFRHYVEGRSFTAFTDHKPLVGAMTNAVDHSPRQTRHLSFVADFTNDVQHVSS